jgi:hypothetical protein
MRTEVLMAVKTLILIFWVVTPCKLLGRYQHFGGIYCLYPQDLSPENRGNILVSTYKSTWHNNPEDQN